MNNLEIVALFSYSQEEQDVFPYLAKYMHKIERHLPLLLEDKEVKERFMLAGLFLTYRAFNHMSVNLTTDKQVLDSYFQSIHIRRLNTYREESGKHIENALHYLKLIHLNFLNFFPIYLTGMGRHLYRFVISG